LSGLAVDLKSQRRIRQNIWSIKYQVGKDASETVEKRTGIKGVS
jgi:hypothetical protein